jgi:hypothetical protein
MHEVRMTLADVIGMPNTWPNYAWRNDGQRVDMHGARISEVAASHDELLIATVGSVGGRTFSVFQIEDRKLLKRAMKVLKAGLNVDVAARLAI